MVDKGDVCIYKTEVYIQIGAMLLIVSGCRKAFSHPKAPADLMIYRVQERIQILKLSVLSSARDN